MNNKKFTLLYCINTLTGGGGTARVIAQKASYFTDILGYTVHILVSYQGGKAVDYDFSHNIHIHYMEDELKVPTTRIRGVGFLQYLKNAKKVYYQKIAQIDPDFITVVGPFFEDFIIPQIGKKLGIKTIREFHFAKKAYIHLCNLPESSIERFKSHVMRLMTLRRFNAYDCVVLLTESDAKSSAYTTKSVVIPNVSEIGIINCAPALKSKRAISVGSMRSNVKRFDLQIKMWKKFIVTNPDWTLHIYGDGRDMPKLQELVKDLSLEKSVFLHGSSNKIPEKYLESAICLSTSVAEGFGLTITEAAEAGLPVISIDCPCGPSDIIIDGITGYLIDEGDMDTFLHKLRELADNQDLIHKMSSAAKENAKNFFIDQIIPKWIALYNDLNTTKN